MVSFSSRSARPLADSSQGSNPRSSSGRSLVLGPNPKAACQSVQLETSIDSLISGAESGSGISIELNKITHLQINQPELGLLRVLFDNL